MLKHVKGDVFKSKADVILHQVNCQGVMGSGIARQVREKYPVAYQMYVTVCAEDKKRREEFGCGTSLLGLAQVCPRYNYLYGDERDEQFVVNLFAQDEFGYGKCYTDYEALHKCLVYVNEEFCGKTVAIPYMIGCCRGGGDWSIVSDMIERDLRDCDVTLYEYNGA